METRCSTTPSRCLLNDLFGVQARSGCACAGPFGHELLGIEKDLSDRYVELILNVLNGFKPGWTRIGIHYTISEEEFEYTLKAMNAVAYFGPLFMDLYNLDPYTGEWTHVDVSEEPSPLSFKEAVFYRGQHTQLPHLDSEETLYKTFSRQWQEFLLICSGKIAEIVIGEAEHLSTDDFDTLTIAIMKPLTQFLDSKDGMDPAQFSENLAHEICPLVAPPGKNPEECFLGIEKMLNQLIFRPQDNISNYEDFGDLARDVDFFYVPKGRLSKTIDLEKVDIKIAVLPGLVLVYFIQRITKPRLLEFFEGGFIFIARSG